MHILNPAGLPPDNRRISPTKADRKSTRLNSSHRCISYAVFCLKKKKAGRSVLCLVQLVSFRPCYCMCLCFCPCRHWQFSSVYRSLPLHPESATTTFASAPQQSP